MKNKMKRKRFKNPEILPMIVSLIAFGFNIAISVLITGSDEITSRTFMYIGIFCLILSFFMPIIAKAYTYSGFFQIEGVSHAQIINTYNLTGWIKGKYLFLDAVGYRARNEFSEAFFAFNNCLAVATDSRLRKACYQELAVNMPRELVNIPILINGFKEFSEDDVIFNEIASYYMWFENADDKEGREFFEKAVELSTSNERKSHAYFYLGLKKLYASEYEEAIELLLKSEELNNNPPAYLYLDIAVNYACLKDNDNARKYALKAASKVDNSGDIDYIKEKLDYLFRINSSEINPETERLVKELHRRNEANQDNSIKMADIGKKVEEILK